MDAVAIDSWGGTHVGLVRSQNEDNLLVRAEIGMWAVADGMGGHDAGDIASGIVVERLRQMPVPDSATSLLRESSACIYQANDEIRALASARHNGTMGTTIAVLLVSGAFYACLWSGDSRVYRVRGQQILQLTRDHSEMQEMLEQGLLKPEDARTWPRRNIITRAVGVFDDVQLEVRHGEIEVGDTFVLCSDGLTTHLDDAEIAQLSASGMAAEIGTRLIEAVLARGAQDNVTVIVVRFTADEQTIVSPSRNGGSGRAG